MVLTHQLAHQPVGEIIEIVQPLAQIRIGLPQHARAGVRLHALGRGFRGQAAHHRLAHLAHPAAVIGEHAIGFEHVAMLAAIAHVAVVDQHVEVGAHGVDRGIEPFQFALHVVGDEVGNDDARLMQHDMAERDALRQRHAVGMQRAAHRRLRARLGERRQFAGGDHLGEHHRRGLQRLLFLLGVGAPRPVLHHHHAERVAGAQDRHAEEGVIGLFAGFRPVGEGRMGLGVGQVDGVGLGRHQADQALFGVEHGLVDRLPVQTLGGV